MTREEAIKNIKEHCYFASLLPQAKEALDVAIKVLEQEPCEDEYIKVPKNALKYRTAGMVAYNAEWLKNHFDIERAVICGEQEPCEDVISRQAVIDVIERWLKCSDYNEAERHIMRAAQSVLYDSPSVHPQEPKAVLYSDDGYADGYMVYDMAECPNCGYEYEESDKDWGLPFCPNCGQSLNWESEDKK